MRIKQNRRHDGDSLPFNSLTATLAKSEAAKELVVEAAVELASINTDLKQNLSEQDSPSGVETALEKNEAVESKVQEASEKLAVVTLALEDEVKDRHLLEGQLAIVTAQGVSDRHAALHDELTGLPNRTLFLDRLENGIAQAIRHGRRLAVFYLDLDGFKVINDTHGHSIGDTVLRTIAGRLDTALRSGDTVSRVGGDEFLYVVMEVRVDAEIASIAEKIIAVIRAPCDVDIPQNDGRVSVGASIGIAVYPECGITASSLMQSADTAMYEAKRSGSGYSFAPAIELSPS